MHITQNCQVVFRDKCEKKSDIHCMSCIKKIQVAMDWEATSGLHDMLVAKQPLSDSTCQRYGTFFNSRITNDMSCKLDYITLFLIAILVLLSI